MVLVIWKASCDAEFKAYISDGCSIILPCIKHILVLFVKKSQSLHMSNSEAAICPNSVVVTRNLCATHFTKNTSSFMLVMRKKCAFIVIVLGIRWGGLKTNLIGLQAIRLVIKKTLNQSDPWLPTCKIQRIFSFISCPTFLDCVIWQGPASSYWHVG